MKRSREFPSKEVIIVQETKIWIPTMLKIDKGMDSALAVKKENNDGKSPDDNVRLGDQAVSATKRCTPSDEVPVHSDGKKTNLVLYVNDY